MIIFYLCATIVNAMLKSFYFSTKVLKYTFQSVLNEERKSQKASWTAFFK